MNSNRTRKSWIGSKGESGYEEEWTTAKQVDRRKKRVMTEREVTLLMREQCSRIDEAF